MPKHTVVPGQDADLDQDDVRDSHGRRVTPEYAEQAAEDAIRKVRRGRPSLSAGRSQSPRVSVRVPPHVEELLNERAEREGKRPSGVVRDALVKYLNAS